MQIFCINIFLFLDRLFRIDCDKNGGSLIVLHKPEFDFKIVLGHKFLANLGVFFNSSNAS